MSSLSLAIVRNMISTKWYFMNSALLSFVFYRLRIGPVYCVLVQAKDKTKQKNQTFRSLFLWVITEITWWPIAFLQLIDIPFYCLEFKSNLTPRMGERTKCRILHTLQMAKLEAKSRVINRYRSEKTSLKLAFLCSESFLLYKNS